MRDGDPLPGVSPAQVVSQLTHRVFGPLHLNRVRVVLDYHGLADASASTLIVVAARHSVTARTVSLYVKAVRTAGAALPLTPVLIAEATRRSTLTEDHLRRVRIARTLALDATPARTQPPADRTTASAYAQARAASRILAAAGPLDTRTLLDAVGRSRRFRGRKPFSATDLESALQRTGALLASDGRWHAPTWVDVPDRYLAIARAAGNDLTRADMIQVLTDVGYSHASANGRMSSSHPLFRRVGSNRYRVIGTDTGK